METRLLLYCHLLIHAEIYIYIHIYIYIYIYWIHTDAMIKKDAMTQTQEDFFNKIFTSHFIARVRKGCVEFYCERELETEHNWNIFTPKLWPPALCLSRSPGLLNRSPGVHSAGCWLSLLQFVYLISNSTPPSVQFVGLILPSNSYAEIWTRLHAPAISSNIWRSRCVTSSIFGMACVIVIERK